MYFRTHFVFNLFIFLILVKTNVFSINLITLALVFVASAAPDIDIAGSWISKKIKPASNFVHVFFAHREFFHSLTFCIILFIIGLLLKIKTIYVGIFVLFYFLHIVLDSFNPSGIKWFWPLKLRIKGKVKFGGFIEAILFIVCSLGVVILLIFLL